MRVAREAMPEVILIDLWLLTMSGFAAIRQIADELPPSRPDTMP